MLSDVLILLIAAYLLLLLLAFYFEEPLVGIVAGVIGLLMAMQAFQETGSPAVSGSLIAVGLVTLVGAFGDIVSR